MSSNLQWPAVVDPIADGGKPIDPIAEFAERVSEAWDGQPSSLAPLIASMLRDGGWTP